MVKVNLAGQIIVKQILAKNTRLTTREILGHYNSEHTPKIALSYLKNQILKDVWQSGQLVKQIDHAIINPVTKKGTYYWTLEENLKPLYDKVNKENTLDYTVPPEEMVKPDNLVPLLGRTGPFSKFNKEGLFNVHTFQKI